MTLTFDTNLDKPYLATKENKQVVTAYFKSNTSKGKDTMRPFFFRWRYCRRCERRWPYDYNDDDEDDKKRSNDDDTDDFDEDNDSKSEVDHKKKENDELQKEKRWTLLKEDRLRRRFALNSFTFLQIQVWPGKKLNENGLMYLTSWPNWNIWNPFAIFWIFFYSALETHGHGLTIYLSKDHWRSRETHAKDLLLPILWNTFLSNLIKIELGKRVSP